ncbi:transcriptional repressor NrdR [SAR202 cluster bacterium AD-802-E10_MRT_200m]|nr:transcriptional repressor NrdR [SAR202 cluster bacterium AD-802-E10_MRT_200m]
MYCPYCEYNDSKVMDSRDSGEGIKRRRECSQCGLRFSTVERIQTSGTLVVKRDGRREEFNREKVRGGVMQACAKRPVSVSVIDKLVSEVEREIENMGRAEVSGEQIGRIVAERLRLTDRVAYVRFASVYNNFQDIESFALEVASLRATEGQKIVLSDGKPNAYVQTQLSLPLSGIKLQDKRRKKRKG